MNSESAPWLKSQDPEVPATLEYSNLTMAGLLKSRVDERPHAPAYDFTGKKTNYASMWAKIEQAAKGLRAIGIGEDDKVTIAMPNCPQAVILLYAINLVGAIANMVHPLSAEEEILFYLNESESKAALTLDQFYPKFASIRKKAKALQTLIIASVSEELSLMKRIGFALTIGRSLPKKKDMNNVLFWGDFIKNGADLPLKTSPRKPDDVAAILYSGGTTGVTKGILLTNYNFNALSAQIIATNPHVKDEEHLKMLGVMPLFHGFGLGICIHMVFVRGWECLLIPRFTPKTYIEALRKQKPNIIAGVPSLFEALMRVERTEDLDLSMLVGIFSGGDSLSVELKRKFDAFLKARGSKYTVREGYGTTECVTASCLTPLHKQKEGSIGIPFPDMYYCICKPGTIDPLPYGEEGEICLSGPTVMKGYMNHEEETANTLRRHADGRVYVHTGDLGMMDEDGFIFFRQRIKRMIVSNGYNIYPSQLENVLDGHEDVLISCVIGVKDPIKIQRVKAFIVLQHGVAGNDEEKKKILDYARKYIARYALPSEIEFREELPKTLVGKVAYRVLEEEEEKKGA